MNFDISHLLGQWDYKPGQVLVRKFIGKDGQEKIQLRVDLGLLQMNAQGRPDGKRPFGHPSLLEDFRARLDRHVQEHESDEGFALDAEDCAKLQLEAVQFHHRYICLLQLEDYEAVVRDTQRNTAVCEFVAEYADTEELAWSLLQFLPQVIMIETRARATRLLEQRKYKAAIDKIHDGIARLREFYSDYGRNDLLEQSGEIQSLEHWQGEINLKRPLTKREQLEIDLNEAVKREDYEKAALVRDALRKLKPSD